MLLYLNRVSFRYEGMVEPLIENTSVSFHIGWTGIVGANGAGKTTLLRLSCGELEVNSGSISRPGPALYCPQRTDDPPDEMNEFLHSLDSEACDIRGRMKIGADWCARWSTLSHGERKRVQIAVAIWRRPCVLALDEPTNHIDADARTLLIGALERFRGVGLLVSHDRELLDRLCTHCAVVDPPNVTMRPGNYTQAIQQARTEEAYLRERYEQAKTAAQQLKKEYARRKEDASRADTRRSKRHLNPRDHDAKGKIDAARVSGADGKAGRLANQMVGRIQQAQSRLDDFDIKRRYIPHFWLPGSRSPRKSLFVMPAGSIELGKGRRLNFPELTMAPQDRIGVTGPNGSGKTTLIERLRRHISLPEDKVIYLPQEIDAAQSRQIMQEVNDLSPERLGQVMTIVSCLGSRPARLVGSDESSPGEIRKILLALGVSASPHLIIMDEPTNHLDLPAIECMEDALADCPCGLLLVSHDMRFLSRLTSLRWHFSPDRKGCITLQVTNEEYP